MNQCTRADDGTGVAAGASRHRLVARHGQPLVGDDRRGARRAGREQDGGGGHGGDAQDTRVADAIA